MRVCLHCRFHRFKTFAMLCYLPKILDSVTKLRHIQYVTGLKAECNRRKASAEFSCCDRISCSLLTIATDDTTTQLFGADVCKRTYKAEHSKQETKQFTSWNLQFNELNTSYQKFTTIPTPPNHLYKSRSIWPLPFWSSLWSLSPGLAFPGLSTSFSEYRQSKQIFKTRY